jgi:hypothetical protein
MSHFTLKYSRCATKRAAKNSLIAASHQKVARARLLRPQSTRARFPSSSTGWMSPRARSEKEGRRHRIPTHAAASVPRGPNRKCARGSASATFYSSRDVLRRCKRRRDGVPPCGRRIHDCANRLADVVATEGAGPFGGEWRRAASRRDGCGELRLQRRQCDLARSSAAFERSRSAFRTFKRSLRTSSISLRHRNRNAAARRYEDECNVPAFGAATPTALPPVRVVPCHPAAKLSECTAEKIAVIKL